ncbi:O-antigen ligase family protein [Candidatus Shapirobacteria bacterium]|nr:O-antigen ligase family protein [Candidatus Shapirobacteria bacterium]
MEIKKREEFFLWSLFLLLPTQLGYHFWPRQAYVWGLRVDFLSPAVYLTDLLIFCLLLFSWPLLKKAFLKDGKNKTKILIFCLVLSFLGFNILFSLRPLVSFSRFLRAGEFFFLIFVLRKFYFPLWPQALLLGSLLSSFLAWGQVFKGGSLGGVFWWLGERSFNLATPGIALAQLGSHVFLRPYATFSHPNSLAGFLLVLLLLLWGARASFKNKIFFKLAFLFFGLTLLLTFSFAAYLGAGLALIFFLWQRFSSRKISKAGFFLGLLFCLAVLSLSFEIGLVEPKSINDRLLLAKNALILIKERPLLGVGLGNFIPAQAEIISATRKDVNLLQPVHNIYLLVASQAGLTGLLIFITLLFFWLKKVKKSSFPLARGALAMIFFLGFFDHYWLTLPQNFLLFAVVLGLGRV